MTLASASIEIGWMIWSIQNGLHFRLVFNDPHMDILDGSHGSPIFALSIPSFVNHRSGGCEQSNVRLMRQSRQSPI